MFKSIQNAYIMMERRKLKNEIYLPDRFIKIPC